MYLKNFFKYFVSEFRLPEQKTNRFLPINFINHPSCGHYIHGPKIQVNVCHSKHQSDRHQSDRQLQEFVQLQIRKINDRNKQLKLAEQNSPIPTGCFFASLGNRKIFERTTVFDNLYPEMCPSVKMSFIGDNEMQNIASTEFAECHIFANYDSRARNFRVLFQMSNRIASDLQDVMGDDEEFMKLKERICTLKKRTDSLKLHKILLEEVMSCIMKAEKSLSDLTCHLYKLDLLLKDNSVSQESKRLRSLNMTFKELRKLQNIQEDLAPNLQNFESLTQEIVPRLQDCKDILSKITQKLEKREEFEAEVESELKELQHIPKVKQETIKFFVDALSHVQETFYLQNDLVLKIMAAKEDHSREAKTEVELKNVMCSLVILAHRVHIKFGSNTPLELTKLHLLEMKRKELRLPKIQRTFSRILRQTTPEKWSDSYETNKLHEWLYKELREYLSEEEKRNYKEIGLEKLSAQGMIMMSSIKKADKSWYDLKCRLYQLADAEDCFVKDSEILRFLNETFKELCKLQYIQEDLAPNLQNFESLTQEIVPRLQDSKDIVIKVARRYEDFEAEVKSELEELQHKPERYLTLQETMNFSSFLQALSHVQGTFNLQNDLVLKMMAAKEDHSREAKTEVELKNVTRSLAPRACRADFKIGHKEPLLELTKLPLLEMIIKVLELPRSTDRFRRIEYKLAFSDSYETKKLHEELYKGLREELSEEEKKNYKELCPTKNTEENNSLGLHRLESLEFRMRMYSNEEKAFWPGFYHPLFELLDFLLHFSFDPREPHDILYRENFVKLLIASGVLGSESLRRYRNTSGTDHIFDFHELIETLPDFLAIELKKLVKSLEIPHPLGDINRERSISEAIFDSRQILYNAISRARVMCRIHIIVDDYTENGAIDCTLKRLFPEARIKYDKA